MTSGFQGNNLKAIRLADAQGDITDTDAIVWTLDRDTPYVPSPLLYDGILYLLKTNSGILSAFDAKTGKPHYQLQRLEGRAERVRLAGRRAAGASTSPAATASSLVIRNGPTYEVLATNKLDDGFDASPALVDDEIFPARLRQHSYASPSRGSSCHAAMELGYLFPLAGSIPVWPTTLSSALSDGAK